MGGFNNVGADDVVYCDNVDFSGNQPVTKTVTTNGQLLIGSTVAPNIRVGTLASAGGTVTITTGAGTINLETTSVVPTANNSAALVSTSAGVPIWSSTMTNGQMIIGSTGATPAAGMITSTGGTIAVTTGAGTLNLETVNGGFVWNDVSGAFSPLKNNGYFVTGTATGTLPASPAQGDTIKFFVDHASQVLTIDAPGTQLIRMGSLVTSAGGTAVSTLQGDSVELVYRASNTCWEAVGGFTGTWTLS